MLKQASVLSLFTIAIILALGAGKAAAATVWQTYCNVGGAYSLNGNITPVSGINVTYNAVDNRTITWNKSTTTGAPIAFYELQRWVEIYNTTTHNMDLVANGSFIVMADNINNPATYTYTADFPWPMSLLYFKIYAWDQNCQYNYDNSTSRTPNQMEQIGVFFKDGGVWNNSFGLDTDNYFTGDFNGDGKGDIMISTVRINANGVAGDNDLAWYFMPGNGSTFSDGGQWNSSFGVNADKYYVADFNGDNKDDILISTTRVNGDGVAGNNDLAWYLMLSSGKKFIDGGQIAKSFGLDADKYYVADFNGDHMDDIVVSTTRIDGDGIAGNNDLAWYLMRSVAKTFVDGGKINNSYGLDVDKFLIGDFNNDKKQDLVMQTTRFDLDSDGTTTDVGFYWMKSTGTALIDGVLMNEGSGITYNATDKFFIANLNNDGRDDLLVARENGVGGYFWGALQTLNLSTPTSSDLVPLAYGYIRDDFGKPGDLFFVNQFTDEATSDVVVARTVGGSLRWYGMYSRAYRAQ